MIDNLKNYSWEGDSLYVLDSVCVTRNNKKRNNKNYNHKEIIEILPNAFLKYPLVTSVNRTSHS
jgi:hypothetical protein